MRYLIFLAAFLGLALAPGLAGGTPDDEKPDLQANKYTAILMGAPADGWWVSTDGRYAYLFENGELSRAIHLKSGKEYVTKDNGKNWTPATDAEATPVNFGLEQSKLFVKRQGYFYNGLQVSREEALNLLQAKLPDESRKWHITAIGDPAFQTKVKAAWQQKPDLSKWANLHVAKPEDFRMKSWGLEASLQFGKTRQALFVQDASGKVVHGQYTFADGDMDWVANRFDPNKVPNQKDGTGNQSVDMLLERIKKDPAPWVALGVVILLLYIKRKD